MDTRICPKHHTSKTILNDVFNKPVYHITLDNFTTVP